MVIQHYLNGLFGLCLKFMNVMYCILFEFMIKNVLKYFFYIFASTRGYPWILKHYVGILITDTQRVRTGTWRIFI